ncbi:MAG: hypothetical protein LBU62_04625 [Bacteroidales bacterium]|jgi:hypothetical protein|nr:hypothetical protein [Bacteroidales bacterium]
MQHSIKDFPATGFNLAASFDAETGHSVSAFGLGSGMLTVRQPVQSLPLTGAALQTACTRTASPRQSHLEPACCSL